MGKSARIPLTLHIPKSLDRDLRKAANGQNRSFDSVIESCLEAGLKQFWWIRYAADHFERVTKAQSTPGLTGMQKRAIQWNGLTEFAETVAAVTNRRMKGQTPEKGRIHAASR